MAENGPILRVRQVVQAAREGKDASKEPRIVAAVTNPDSPREEMI